MKRQIQITIALGFFTLLAGFLAHMALLDIYHLEPDVSLEWSILQGCALIFALFIGMTLFTLCRVLKTYQNRIISGNVEFTHYPK